jgi:hypothetical protein
MMFRGSAGILPAAAGMLSAASGSMSPVLAIELCIQRLKALRQHAG